jgi:hypothetical protein
LAKTATAKKTSREPFRLDTFIIEIAGKFGISGACILTILYVFLNYGTLAQKREFIDKFILLKTSQGDNGYILYLVIIIVVAFIGQTVYFRNRIKLKNERIKELEQHSNALENKFLKR